MFYLTYGVGGCIVVLSNKERTAQAGRGNNMIKYEGYVIKSEGYRQTILKDGKTVAVITDTVVGAKNFVLDLIKFSK